MILIEKTKSINQQRHIMVISKTSLTNKRLCPEGGGGGSGSSSVSPVSLTSCGAVDEANHRPDETQQLYLFMYCVYCTTKGGNTWEPGPNEREAEGGLRAGREREEGKRNHRV